MMVRPRRIHGSNIGRRTSWRARHAFLLIDARAKDYSTIDLYDGVSFCSPQAPVKAGLPQRPKLSMPWRCRYTRFTSAAPL